MQIFGGKHQNSDYNPNIAKPIKWTHTEADPKVMQTHFPRQTSLKARLVLRPFSPQAEGVEQLVVPG
jgi:hypothetical protein